MHWNKVATVHLNFRRILSNQTEPPLTVVRRDSSDVPIEITITDSNGNTSDPCDWCTLCWRQESDGSATIISNEPTCSDTRLQAFCTNSVSGQSCNSGGSGGGGGSGDDDEITVTAPREPGRPPTPPVNLPHGGGDSTNPVVGVLLLPILPVPVRLIRLVCVMA